MDQDDPEKRIADPEDQPAEEPHGVKRLMIWAVLVTIGLVWLLDGLFAAYDSYVYFVGTPTTATMGQCTQGFHLGQRHTGGMVRNHARMEYADRVTNAVVFRKEGCTGTWSVGGASHSGPIVGGDIYRNYRPGDSMDVRVHDGRAYTTHSLEDGLGMLGFTVAVPVALLAMFAVYVVWSSRRTDE